MIESSEISNEHEELFHDENHEEGYQVIEEDLAKKEGNYIFTVGNVSSGKSTLQNMLIYRLWSKENIIFDYGNNTNDHRQRAIINRWVDSFKQGILPQRTQQGVIQEFNIEIGQKGKQKLDVSFLEISGEDIKSIVPSYDFDRKPSVHNFLDRYLMSENGINKRFIFVSDGEKHKKGIVANVNNESEDILFDAFLRYLLGETQKGLKEINILFVVSKWDTVREDYKNNFEKYMKRNFPQTLGILNGSRVTVMYLPFTVGKIDEKLIDKEKGIYEHRITTLENSHIDRLIQWVYYTFTGETLKEFPPIKPSLLYRIAKMLRIR